MPLELTEQLVVSMAPAEGTVLDARGLIKKGAFRSLSRTEDNGLVFGDCQGSGKQPYKVSIDLDTGADRPTTRCNCPSRQFPCKHALGLMLAFVAKGAEFKVASAPADLIEKRGKLKEKNEKAAAADTKPRVVNKAAVAKKAEAQADALDTLEKYLVDLVAAGLGGVNAKSVKAIQDQAKRMADADLQGARGALTRLSALVEAATARSRKASARADDEDDDDELEFKLKPMTDEERQARMVSLVAQLWTTIRRGRKALTGAAEEGESRSEADAQVESILGKKWTLVELKEAGYWITDRTLIELAHERTDDSVIEMVLNTGYLLDLADGTIHMERSIIPYQALKVASVRHRASREGVLQVKEAALYPGVALNRRIRWDEKNADAVHERARTNDDVAKVHSLAKPLDATLKSFREQLKNPLAGHEAVVLLSAQKFGLTADDTLVMVDPAGGRLALRDPYEAQYPTTQNLRHAAAAFGPGTLAVRLYYDLSERAVFGQALALFVGDKQLRLGL